MPKMSIEAKALLALEQEIDNLQGEASSLNVQIERVHSEFLKKILELSSRHENILLKTIECEKAIYETKKLLCESRNTYSSTGSTLR